ncbi:hypothetical protein ACFQZO_31120 [Bradyrhizobium sp. GCM10027634]|uniref:hypothetical protein n=1 Tax=unclassified Bradyrhizobium TaxID=2631580 RepID=UPI00263BDC94|nr:hypothetical protein [Bradyrhizobium sp. WYCCWR 12677]MDN5005314.1 hypothetical protein [Bradyrhizobium sp. WYCCWR 12677]
MRTILILLAIWLLINVLFVVVMIPPRKSRKRGIVSGTHAAAPVVAGMAAGPKESHDDGGSLRHVIIAIALGVFFSLTPPLLEAYDEIRGWIRKRGRVTKRPLDGPSD